VIIPVILCGGAGTRLWPMSRNEYPKQLLSLVGNRSLLQQTIGRLEGIDGIQDPVLICNEAHRFLVAEQLREVGIQAQAIILEPEGKNTAPAVSLALQWAALVEEDDPLLLILPSDHVIREEEAFKRSVDHAARLAKANYLVTFGIAPRAPETGFGYLEHGEAIEEAGFVLRRFHEKPDEQTAIEYLRSGHYSWNSGMFLFSRNNGVQAFERWAPSIWDSVGNAWASRTEDFDFLRPDPIAFSNCLSDSIDYAVMEQADHAAIVPMEAGWSDLGSWSSVWEEGEKDDLGNVVKGDVVLEATSNALIQAEHRLVAAAGVSDITIIETADAVLVADRSASQSVKSLVQRLSGLKRNESSAHRRVFRPWGWYEAIDQGAQHQVKRISVSPGARLSLQKHQHRAEHWIVVSGTARVTCDDQIFELLENQSTYIPQGSVHRLENPGTLPLEIIEVQSGSYLGEDDIVRFEDNYGRA